MKPETRCGSCIRMGVECPLGYFGGVVSCDVCGFRFTLSASANRDEVDSD